MPFQPNNPVTVAAVSGQVSNPPAVVLDVAGWDDFRLLNSLTFQGKDGVLTVVNPSGANSTTDLASVPKLLWGILGPYGHQLRAALLHDQLCNEAKQAQTKAARITRRRAADALFREALADSEVSVLRRNAFWTGVSFGRYLAFHKFLVAVLSVLALAATIAFWVNVTILGAALWNRADWGTLWGPLALWGGLLVVAPLLFWTDRRFVITALLIAPLIVPTGVLTLVTQLVLYFIDWVLTIAMRVAGRSIVPPVIGPTFDWRVGKE